MSQAPLTTTSAPTPVRVYAALALLLGTALLSLGLEARVWLRGATQAEYDDATRWVQSEWRDTDRYSVAPAWALRPLEQLGALPAVGISAAQEGLVFGATRLWVVADADGADALQRLAGFFQEDARRTFGPLTVVRFVLAPEPMWGAVHDVARAQVRLFKRQAPEGTLCNQRQNQPVGWLCPGEPDWLRTTAEWLDTGGVPSGGDLALWMHPPARGDRKEVLFPAVKLGRTLRVGGAHTEFGARTARAPVQVSVRVGNQTLLQRAWEPHHGWQVSSLALSPEVVGTAQDVTLVVESDDNAGNHFALSVGVVP